MKLWLKGKYLFWFALPILIWWVFRNIPFSDIWNILQSLEAWKIFGLIVVNLGILPLLSIRWWFILRSLGFRLPFLGLAAYRLAGFSLSYFTPGPQFGGEPWLVHVLNKRRSIPPSSAIASVTLDKLLEIIVNFSFIMIGLILIVESTIFSAWLHASLFPTLIGLLSSPLLVLVALGFGLKPVSWVFDKLPVRVKHARLVQVVYSAEAQASDFCRRKPASLLGLLGMSMFIWGVMVGEYWLMLRILGLSLPLHQTVMALTAARLALLVPVPGGLGTLEASQVFIWQMLGYDPAFGAGVAVLIRGRDLVFALAGLWLTAYLTRRTKETSNQHLGAKSSTSGGNCYEPTAY